MNSNLAALYEFSLLQSVAECYLPINVLDSDAVRDAVRLGNNRCGYLDQTRMSRLTDAQTCHRTVCGHLQTLSCECKIA